MGYSLPCKDATLAYKIKEFFNGGTIVHSKDRRYFDLKFQDLKSIQNIAINLQE